MANRGPLRGAGRGRLVDTGGERHVTAFIGAVHYREHFTDVNGTLLTAHAPAEGPAGNWTSNQGGAPNSVPEIQNNKIIQVAPLIATSAVHNAGQADGCWSWVLKNTATPSTQQRAALGFRLPAAALIDGLPGHFTTGWTVVMSSQGAFGMTLVKDGVTQGNAIAVPFSQTANASIVIEVMCIGDRIIVWANGILCADVTDSAHQADTYVGVGHGAAGGFGSTAGAPLEEVFVTQFPSAPGAWPNNGATFRDLFPLAPFAQGEEFTARTRWGKVGVPTNGPPLITPVFHRIKVWTDDITAGTPIRQANSVVVSAEDEGGYATLACRMDSDADPATTTNNRSGLIQVSADCVGDTGGVAMWTITTHTDGSGGTGATFDHGKCYTVASVTASVQVPATTQYVSIDVTTPITFNAGLTLQAHVFRDAAATRPIIDLIQDATARGTGVGTVWIVGESHLVDIADTLYNTASQLVGFRATAAAMDSYNNDPYFVITAVLGASGYRKAGVNNEIVESSDSGTAFTETAFTVDARVIVQQYMQIGTIFVETPPDLLTDLTHNVLNKLSTEIGLIALRFKNGAGQGINNISLGAPSIVDVGNIGTIKVRAGSTFKSQTLNGAAGWVVATGAGGASPNFLAWDSGAPGGIWNHSYLFTGPTGGAQADVRGLEFPPAPQQYILNSPSPYLTPNVQIGPLLANEGEGWHPGDGLLIAFTIEDSNLDLLQRPISAEIGLRSFNQTLDRYEYLRPSDLTWQPASGALTNFTSATNPQVLLAADNVTNRLIFTAAQTITWSSREIVIVVAGADSTGTTYARSYPLTVLNRVFPPVFDSLGGLLS